ncbi:MAG: hypothetical protein MSS84_02460 [Bacteroidales bacterium]|nr:hypothetical protein [Bacteroidales bacterium]
MLKKSNKRLSGIVLAIVVVLCLAHLNHAKVVTLDMAAVAPIYQSKIDDEGALLLAEARAIWAAGQNAEKGEEAGAILVKINPSSKSYAEAIAVNNEIAKRIKEIDQREWDFALKQQQDEVDIQKANIKAMRDIGVAFGENQQPITYNIRTWW